MDIIESIITPEILSLLYRKQSIFLPVIDKYHHGKKESLLFYQIGKRNKENFFVCQNGSLYFSDIQKEQVAEIACFLENHFTLYHIYGNTCTIEQLKKPLVQKVKQQYDYYFMELNRKDFSAVLSENRDYQIRFCNEKDFSLLSELQYLYHKEEVYTDTDNYPYHYEMESFRHLLRCRENAALFLNGKAISKVYVSSESSDRYQLGGVFTRRAYRKCGYAYQCMAFFLHVIFAEHKEKKYVQLFVKKNNCAALSLYLRLGFKITGKTSYLYF